MARGKSKVNAREARREQALQSIVDSMIGPYGDFVREQLQDVSQRLRAARAAQAAPPPGAGAPGAIPLAGGGGYPPPHPPISGGLWGPQGPGGAPSIVPAIPDVAAGQYPGPQVPPPMPGMNIPAPFNPYMPVFEDNSQMPTDPSFHIPPPAMAGIAMPQTGPNAIIEALLRTMNPNQPAMPPGQRF